ncbi:hypothetical protein F5X97DRAFT_127612 [Nemania serpens]|nr:hypothetical protein F5X97DRAFT_127612 [Nemania serpens]
MSAPRVVGRSLYPAPIFCLRLLLTSLRPEGTRSEDKPPCVTAGQVRRRTVLCWERLIFVAIGCLKDSCRLTGMITSTVEPTAGRLPYEDVLLEQDLRI